MVFEKVREIVAENLGLEEDEITLDSKFEDLDVDSLDLFQVIMEAEDEFGVSIEKPETMLTVRDVVEFIEANK